MKTRLRRLWGVAAIPLLIPFVAPAITPNQDTQAVRIRVLAYNIKHGEGMDAQVDLERAARVIRSLNPDLVTLQEIDDQTTRTDGIDQAQRLGELTGMHHAFGLFMEYRGGHYGMALLSRYPFEAVANHRLPDGEEPRTALAGRVRIGGVSGPEIIFVGIHLYRTADERLAQARRLIEVFDGVTTPVILAGDFNSTPDSEVLNLLRQSWNVPMKGDDHFTFSSVDPRREIDFIMYRPAERFELVEYRVIDEPLASDHRPVLMVIDLK